MRLATAAEAKRIDYESVRATGQEAEEFMERAGLEMANQICSRQLIRGEQAVAVLCGPGHNGGDGFVVGRILRERGFENVKIYYLEGHAQAELWHKMFSDLLLKGIEPIKIERVGEFGLTDHDVIVDALFGVGLSRPLGEPWLSLIQKIHEAGKPVISLDTPSGLHCDRGVPWPKAVQAQWTLTCEIAKPGFFLQEGPQFVGKLLRIPVGFPREVVCREAKSVRLVTRKLIPALFPSRSSVTNKAKQGHLLVLAGSKGMAGAMALCAGAAARLGVGYVSVCSLASDRDLSGLPPDYLHLSLKEFYKSDLKKYSAIVVGPGLGRSLEVLKILKHLIRLAPKVLVDADALSFLSLNPGEDFEGDRLPPSWLVTPHAGELGKILECSALELEEDRLGAAERAYQKLRCMVLFKGFRTVVFNSKLKFIIGAGSAALAKAGTGDVLAGFIGSLMAQGLKTDEAAVLAALIHGDLADRWVQAGRGDFSLQASDLLRLQTLVSERK